MASTFDRVNQPCPYEFPTKGSYEFPKSALKQHINKILIAQSVGRFQKTPSKAQEKIILATFAWGSTINQPPQKNKI